MSDRRQSRLERMLARLATQKACLEFAQRELAGRPGVVLELGLGKGRTYDHLRKLFPAREIHVFDRAVHAPPDCILTADRLWLGDLREQLASPRIAALQVALVHSDLGSDDSAGDAHSQPHWRR